MSGHGRVAPYDQALEDALIDFAAWKRQRRERMSADALELVSGIEHRLPGLRVIVLTNRARHCLDNAEAGIFSQAFRRVLREAERAPNFWTLFSPDPDSQSA